jgi:hypothetical protein
MRVATSALLSVAVCLAVLPASAAPRHRLALRGAEASAPVEPLSFDGDLRDRPAAPGWSPGQPTVELPRTDHAAGRLAPPEDPAWRDPLAALQEAASLRQPDTFEVPELGVAGIGFTGAFPPDVSGEPGSAHYVQMVNGSGGSQFRVFDRSGTALTAVLELDSLWTGGGACATGGGRGSVLWDGLASRFVMAELASTQTSLCVYVSKTANPVSGGFWAYAFSLGGTADHVHLAAWTDAYYAGSHEAAPAAYALDRARMLAGQAATAQRFATSALPAFTFEALTPVDLDGVAVPPPGSPGLFLRPRDAEAQGDVGASDRLELFAFHADWATPGSSTFTGPTDVPLSAFDSSLCGLTGRDCIPQSGTSQLLDPHREEIAPGVRYRRRGPDQSIVGAFAVDVGSNRAGVRWFELGNAGAGWSASQQGTFVTPEPGSSNRWLPAIAPDRRNDMAVAYNVSSPHPALPIFPSIRYTGREVGDQPGLMSATETLLKAGTAAQSGSNRWGDHAALAADPVDGCGLWATAPYGDAAHWETWIGRFRFPNCGRPSAADFDGDGVSNVTVYRSGTWLSTDFSGVQTGIFTGTGAGCIPLPMDYDGDGRVDFTQFCQGAWHFYNADGTYRKGIWVGNLGNEQPVPADYDGDGRDDMVLFRDGAWFFFSFDTETLVSSVFTGPGPSGGRVPRPVPMDVDGDGRADLTVHMGDTWHFFSPAGAYLKGIFTGEVDGDLPVPADYDGDGKDNIVLWRNGTWFDYDYGTGSLTPHSVFTGAPTFLGTPLPAPLDYDGDGIVDYAVYSGGPWHFYRPDGSYRTGVWVGAVAGDRPLSRRILP